MTGWSWSDVYPGRRAVTLVVPRRLARAMLEAAEAVGRRIGPSAILMDHLVLAAEDTALAARPPAPAPAREVPICPEKWENSAPAPAGEAPVPAPRTRAGRAGFNNYGKRGKTAAPAVSAGDRALIDQAVAEGHVTKVAPGSALPPRWLMGEGI
jgi:hypothetical protein